MRGSLGLHASGRGKGHRAPCSLTPSLCPPPPLTSGTQYKKKSCLRARMSGLDYTSQIITPYPLKLNRQLRFREGKTFVWGHPASEEAGLEWEHRSPDSQACALSIPSQILLLLWERSCSRLVEQVGQQQSHEVTWVCLTHTLDDLHHTCLPAPTLYVSRGQYSPPTLKDQGLSASCLLTHT